MFHRFLFTSIIAVAFAFSFGLHAVGNDHGENAAVRPRSIVTKEDTTPPTAETIRKKKREYHDLQDELDTIGRRMADVQAGASAYQVKTNDADNFRYRNRVFGMPFMGTVGAFVGGLGAFKGAFSRGGSLLGWTALGVAGGVAFFSALSFGMGELNGFLNSPGPDQIEAYKKYVTLQEKISEVSEKLARMRDYFRKYSIDF
jgi:hypothetical protein